MRHEYDVFALVFKEVISMNLNGSSGFYSLWRFFVQFAVATFMIVMEKGNHILEICPTFSSYFSEICLESRVTNSHTFPDFFSPGNWDLLTPTKCTIEFQFI